VDEVRYAVGYEVFPETTRNASFDKYVSTSGVTLYHLGTIHGGHLESKTYGLGHLQAVIEGLRPDVLLVESLPEELEHGNDGDGPIEMPVVTLIARRAGIAVVGIDWWTEAWLLSSSGGTDEERDDHMFANLQRSLPAAGRVLVLTGFSHVLEFRSRYGAAGFTSAPFSGEEKDALFAGAPAEFRVPDGLAESLDEGIARMSARRDATDRPELKETFAQWVQSREAARASLAEP
jgi:hypothetical protein